MKYTCKCLIDSQGLPRNEANMFQNGQCVTHISHLGHVCMHGLHPKPVPVRVLHTRSNNSLSLSLPGCIDQPGSEASELSLIPKGLKARVIIVHESTLSGRERQ